MGVPEPGADTAALAAELAQLRDRIDELAAELTEVRALAERAAAEAGDDDDPA